MDILKIEKGQKTSLLGVKTISQFEHPSPRIAAIGPNMFIIVLQADWTKRELKDISNSRVVIDIANINDVVDIVITMGNALNFDVAYDVNLTVSEIEFQELEEGTGVAFHIILVAPDTTVLYQRLVSLDTEQSNDFINTLLEVKAKGYTREQYYKKIIQLYHEMTVDDIKRNAFIHQNFFKTR